MWYVRPDKGYLMMISIVILTWNRYKFLELCLASLFSNLSGLFDYEIFIMDNGSTDKTSETIDTFKKHPNITVIRNQTNLGLNAYKRLFNKSKGDYIIEIDDDILEFPKDFDKTMCDYLEVFRDYGFLALNVVQDARTNGAKLSSTHYTDDIRGNMIVENGPTGGWCTCFRRSDYRKIRLFFNLIPLNMKRCEDGMLVTLFRFFLNLKSGIIKNTVCLHACGAYYAKLYSQSEREIQKYLAAGLTEIAKSYTLES
jgi:glycosyltransferase involved in cell wall biosynthesis